MKSLTEQLAQYASYHRDQRNVWTHFIGIPMIVLSVATLLSRWRLGVVPIGSAGLEITVAVLVSAMMAVYYLRLDLRYGLVMSGLLALACTEGSTLAQGSMMHWLAWGLGLFLVGWVIQFLGHYFEGRKPAFVDDLIGLAIGPLFVVAELGFLLGWRPEVHQAVISRAGALR